MHAARYRSTLPAWLIAGLTLCLLAWPAAAASIPADAVPRARELAGELLAAAGIPGISVAVGVDGKVVWSEGFGLANLETPSAVGTATQFRAASVSKVMTVALMARLAAKGMLDLDAPIQTYLPEFPDQGKGKITLRLLSGHLGGIRHYVPKDDAADKKHFDSLGAALELFSADNLVAPPGERYNYSTFGYTLIGAAIEAATKKPFLDVLREEVLAPLGMDHSGGDLRLALIPGRSGFYERGRDGKLANIEPDDPSYKWPGGGLLTTSEDLVRLGFAHLGGDFLTAAQRRELFESQVNAAGAATNVGIGWRIGKDWRGRTIYHHAGSQAGSRTVLILYPEEKLVVALMSNLSNSPAGIENTAQMLAEPFLPPKGEAIADPPTFGAGPLMYRGKFRGEAVSGVLLLGGEGAALRGTLSIPKQMAAVLNFQGLPSPTAFEIVGVYSDGAKRALVVATPFGLLPLMVEQREAELIGNLTMSSVALDFRAQPLATLIPPTLPDP
jgi:serine beta-lactamase-like protein LACTB